MNTAQFGGHAEYVLELISIVAFALSGAMLAIRKDFDVVGIIFLTEATALDNDIVRDVLINTVPPTTFQNLNYLLPSIAVELITAIVHQTVGRIHRSILFFDAVGLALFTVNGTLLTHDADLSPIPTTLLNITTNISKNLIRDVIAHDTPLIIHHDNKIYTIPTTLKTLIITFTDAQGTYGPLVGINTTVLILTLQLTTLKFN